MRWTLVALTLDQVALHLKKISGSMALSVAPLFLRCLSYSGTGVIVDCKDPYLQEWVLQRNNTPHRKGYTMKVEQRRPRLKPEDISALAHKDVSEEEPLDRLNPGDKTTMTYTHRPFPHGTAVNAVNADAKADPNTAEPTDTHVNAVGQPNHPAKKTADPGSKAPHSNQSVFQTLEAT